MMNHIQLNNGVSMPQLGLGVYKITDEAIPAVVKTALDAGYRAFDTAHFYFNEASLGKALNESNIPREELFITTKLWNDHQGYEQTKQAFNVSLQKLNMEYIDLYLIHWPCPEDDLFIESYKAMEELYHEGKIKALGVANFKEHHLDKLLQETTVVPTVNQIEYHPIFNQDKLQQYCKDKGIAVTAWSPLMRGGELFENETLKRIAEKYNKTVAQIIIRWHIDSGRIVIPKSSNVERIKENIDVCHFELMEQDIEAINDLNRNERQFKDPDKIKIGDMK
ncbi:aldo/keto reductase [Macrococcus armenti]|uniref:aldo/keto reductase n=1 Tax=Macrococcus armenti TaxID=2875764 RepID=UPI001CCD71B5|nr:aldo/keto reductase [Macrococcus armenti]UBH09127.1 aldo/keto reductase [Macrococcus armenti]UBH11422.1 aldo/keto reductase [Macrococcus armenti]UBH15903.1 aldo/keto reductase [Macrococcus armenti]UBH18264.1 aldo/keto reductase [Macrococcus armenti]UBH20529.1 aldo/keto reductase [Macrococcus armenti]